MNDMVAEPLDVAELAACAVLDLGGAAMGLTFRAGDLSPLAIGNSRQVRAQCRQLVRELLMECGPEIVQRRARAGRAAGRAVTLSWTIDGNPQPQLRVRLRLGRVERELVLPLAGAADFGLADFDTAAAEGAAR